MTRIRGAIGRVVLLVGSLALWEAAVRAGISQRRPPIDALVAVPEEATT